MIISVAEEMNPTKRASMEDVHRITPHFDGQQAQTYIAVYDGHGGRGIVDFLETKLEANIALEMKVDPVKPQQPVPSPPISKTLSAIERGYLITDMQSRAAGIMSSGATAVTCLVNSSTNKLYSANCGDARAVLVRENYKALRLTHDHKADDPEEIQRIEAAGGFFLRNRVLGILAVARSFGDHGMKEFVTGRPFLSETDLLSTDNLIIVACDGLWDVIEDQDCADLIEGYEAAGEKREEMAQILLDEALRRGSTDNISVIIAWLD